MENKTEQHAEHHEHHTGNWYDGAHKWMLILPAIVLIFSIIYLANFNSSNGDIIHKDVSLTGGTTVSVFDAKADINKLQESLKGDLPDLKVTQISDIRTGGQRGFILETKESANTAKAALERYLGYNLTDANSSVEFTGSTLSSGFYMQLRNSVFAAFILMGCVVFLIFGSSWVMRGIALMLTGTSIKLLIPGTSTIVLLAVAAIIAGLFMGLFFGKPKAGRERWMLAIAAVASIAIFFFASGILVALILQIALIALYTVYSVPSIAVILCAFADIIMTIVVVDMMGMALSSAGVIAFLMLIGYSVDTDILLTSRVMKKQEGTTNERVWGAFKTGMTMTLTAFASVAVCLFIVHSISGTLNQIFTILLIGLSFDIFNTWITNASLIKWYADRSLRHEAHN